VITSFKGATISRAQNEPPTVMNIEGASRIPIMVPPEVITDITIQARPPTRPIIVAISI
jgi:hypothetical protein